MQGFEGTGCICTNLGRFQWFREPGSCWQPATCQQLWGLFQCRRRLSCPSPPTWPGTSLPQSYWKKGSKTTPSNNVEIGLLKDKVLSCARAIHLEDRSGANLLWLQPVPQSWSYNVNRLFTVLKALVYQLLWFSQAYPINFIAKGFIYPFCFQTDPLFKMSNFGPRISNMYMYLILLHAAKPWRALKVSSKISKSILLTYCDPFQSS